MVYVFLADGFEEIEAFAPVDILRRAGIECQTVGVTGKTVTGSHAISVITDITADELDMDLLSAVILPGGMPGTTNLNSSDTVRKAVMYAAERGLLVAAICAAPSVLGHLGLLRGKKATCFPGFEPELTGAVYQDTPVCRDGNIITSHGAGAALDFAFAVLDALKGEKNTGRMLSNSMKFKREDCGAIE